MLNEVEAAKELTAAHWGYIEKTLALHGMQQEELAIIEHHYTTAMIHGIGHGIEMERRGDFRPRIGESLTMQEVADTVRDILGPSDPQEYGQCAQTVEISC